VEKGRPESQAGPEDLCGFSLAPRGKKEGELDREKGIEPFSFESRSILYLRKKKDRRTSKKVQRRRTRAQEEFLKKKF